MRALVVDPDAPERVAIEPVPEPEPGPGEALVEVRAISLNRGEMWRIQRAESGWRPGWDAAGTVVRAAPGGPPEGARVVALVDAGAWAERVVVPAGWMAELPEEVSFQQASTLPVAGLTALRILRLGRPLLGSRVLVTGAAGGVGRFAVQLAHLGGAHVTAIVGSEERGRGLRELGADEVVVGPDAVSGRYDLVLESAGGESLGRLMRVVDPDGTLVMFGNSSDRPTTFDVRDVYLRGMVRLVGFTLFHTLAGDPPARDLATLAGLVARRRLLTEIEAELPWERMPEALARLRDRRIRGKLVLSVR